MTQPPAELEKPAQPEPGPVAKGCGCLFLIAIVALPIWLAVHFLGGDDEDTVQAPSAATSPSSSPPLTPSPSLTPSLEPPPSPEPLPPPPPADSLGSRDTLESYLDDIVAGDIDWADTPGTDPPRERLLGQNTSEGQIFELLGPPAAVDEVSLTVVMNGTSVALNERTLVPVVRATIELAGDDAGRFVGAELDEISQSATFREKQVTKPFGKREVTFNSFDVVDMIVVTIKVVP